jgi:outer membrane receptor protein involved in Fe transport
VHRLGIEAVALAMAFSTLASVSMGASTSFGLGQQSFNVNVFDLDRVEILNGPQGTLYGANALGGTLKYITTAPDTQLFGVKGESEVSSTQHGGTNYAVRGMINMPVASGFGALRLDGVD